MDIHSVLNMFAEPNRTRIITILYNNELTVTEICDILELSQANTSKHLKKLLDAKMVKNRCEGSKVYYFINDVYRDNCKILYPIISTYSEYEAGKKDIARLEEIKN